MVPSWSLSSPAQVLRKEHPDIGISNKAMAILRVPSR
jgi:hypothetical protein